MVHSLCHGRNGHNGLLLYAVFIEFFGSFVAVFVPPGGGSVEVSVFIEAQGTFFTILIPLVKWAFEPSLEVGSLLRFLAVFEPLDELPVVQGVAIFVLHCPDALFELAVAVPVAWATGNKQNQGKEYESPFRMHGNPFCGLRHLVIIAKKWGEICGICADKPVMSKLLRPSIGILKWDRVH